MASITITTTAAQDARLGPAFGYLLNTGGNATPAQVKAWLVTQLRGVVVTYETRQAIAAIAPPGDFSPS